MTDLLYIRAKQLLWQSLVSTFWLLVGWLLRKWRCTKKWRRVKVGLWGYLSLYLKYRFVLQHPKELSSGIGQSQSYSSDITFVCFRFLLTFIYHQKQSILFCSHLVGENYSITIF